MEHFGCGREISTDNQVLDRDENARTAEPQRQGALEELQALIEDMQGEEAVMEGARFVLPDEEELVELLQGANRPVHLSTARQTGGQCWLQ